jgi:cytochrome c553
MMPAVSSRESGEFPAERQRGARLCQEGDAAAGLASCGACHEGAKTAQPQGPLLKSQHAAYLAKQLRDCRSGNRRWFAKLSGQDIAALAAYRASEGRARQDMETPDPEKSGLEKPAGEKPQ